MIRAFGAVLLVVVLLVAGMVGTLLWVPGPLLRAGPRVAGIESVAFPAPSSSPACGSARRPVIGSQACESVTS